MDTSEANLDSIEAQSSMDVSHEQQKRGYFPMNLVKEGARTLCSRGDGATIPESVPEFLTTFRWSDLYNHPGESVTMNWKIFCAMEAGNRGFLTTMKDYETPMACFKNATRDTILHLAAASGHLELVKDIVSECPCLLLEPNLKGRVPLHVAACAGHTAVIEALVAALNLVSAILSEEGMERLNIYALEDMNGDTVLHLALKYLHGKRKRPRSKSISNPKASTPLIKTIVCLVNANQHASFVENRDGITPLYMAVEIGNVSFVNAMLSCPGNDIQGRMANLSSQLQGQRSFVHAALKAKNIDVLDVILNENPSLVDELDEESRTCLSVAVASVRFYKEVCYLLDRSIEAIYVRDKDGYFPIHMAAKTGRLKILKEILRRCPDALELPGKYDQKILHVAAENGQVRAVRFLLKFYKDGNKNYINEQDTHGNTPLHLATNNAHAKVVSMLTWDDRIDLYALNILGLTALDTVVKNIGTSHGIWEALTWVPLISAGAARGIPIRIPGLGVNKDQKNTFLVVSTLVATMTFAAGFALPGGYNSSAPNLGMAALANKTAFQVFLVFDTLAMFCSLITTVTLIWTHLSLVSITDKGFKLAMPLLGVSLTSMSIAFMAGTYAAVSHLPLFSYFILCIGLFFLLVLLTILVPYVSPKWSTSPILRRIFYFPYLFMLWAAGHNRYKG